MGSKTKKNVGAIVRRSGVSFRVWAPFAEDVAITGSFNNWSELPLENEGDGYWSVFVREAEAGQEYKYVITRNGEHLFRNDPRALHFTTSAGTSVIAHSTFDWEQDSFQPPPPEEMVIYELHVGTFNRPDAASNGTFYDLMAKLDYLADLGVNMIELMPVSSMMMDRGWGYAIDYIFAVETLYGGRHAFLEFVKAAHARGIGVILDVVYNHFGPDTHLDLWDFDGWHEEGYGGIYFYNDWRAETPWGNTRPDFGRQEVRQYISDNITMWIHDCRVDGLRVDSTIFIRNVKGSNNDPDHDLAEGWLLLQHINNITRKINPGVITIAEDVADNEYITKSVKDGGAGFGTQWELGFPMALRQALSTNDADHINFSWLIAELGRRYNDNPFQRVIYGDSHDSAANGASRLVETIAPGKSDGLFARQQALLAATIVLTAPGIPMLFQGEEFVQGGSFNDWQGMDWSLAKRFAGIGLAHKHLIALRRNLWGNTRGLSGPNVNLIHLDDINKVIVYHRWREGGPNDDVIVVANFSNRGFKEYAAGFPRNGLWKVRFNSSWSGYDHDFRNISVDDVNVENGGGSFTLPPSSTLIFSQDD